MQANFQEINRDEIELSHCAQAVLPWTFFLAQLLFPDHLCRENYAAVQDLEQITAWVWCHTRMKSKPSPPWKEWTKAMCILSWCSHSWEGLTYSIMSTKEQVTSLMAMWINWRSRGEDSKNYEGSRKHGFKGILEEKNIQVNINWRYKNTS